MAVHIDEVTPADAISVGMHRKLEVLYRSTKKFGNDLSDENLVITVAAKRGSEVAHISGGVPQTFAAVLVFFPWGLVPRGHRCVL